MDRDTRWAPPPQGTLKLNTDVSVLPNFEFIGVGGVIRDSSGAVFGAFAERIPGTYGISMGECLAMRAGLIFARESGLRVGLVECDAVNAVRAVQGKSLSLLERTVVDDINFLMDCAGGGSCQYVSRKGNEVAHALAKLAFKNESDCFWLEEVPPSVYRFVSADMALID